MQPTNRVQAILRHLPPTAAPLGRMRSSPVRGFRPNLSAAASSSVSPSPPPQSYTSPLNNESDLGVLWDFMNTYSFGALSAVDRGIPVVSHLPFVLERPDKTPTAKFSSTSASTSSPPPSAAAPSAPFGVLRAHLARANPLCALLAEASQASREVLVVFSGPHGYISPQFYLPEHKNVPTWNYAAVHAYGVPLMDVTTHADTNSATSPMVSVPSASSLDTLVQANEDRYCKDFKPNDGVSPAATWRASDHLSPSTLATQRRFIVGFSLRLTRLQGKFKLSQNKTDVTVTRVIDGLQRTGQQELAEFMVNYRRERAMAKATTQPL